MLYFVHGEREKYVEVQIIDDTDPEGAESFQLILFKPSPGLELGTNTKGRYEGWLEYNRVSDFQVKQHIRNPVLSQILNNTKC